MKTNFDQYLEEKLRDPEFADRFRHADEQWDISLQIAALREARGMTQTDLARAVGTTQQIISRIESPGYGAQSRTTLEKIARALDARVEIRLVPQDSETERPISRRSTARKKSQPVSKGRVRGVTRRS